tara:strand:+ start:1605 stop:2834 length:1230 start_codon:yes stop_codon:yes gene_type:complete
MNERIEKELNALAKRMKQEYDEILSKYNEIALSNSLDVEDDREAMVALTLTRNFVRGSLKGSKSSSGFGQNGFGFLVGIEQARDVQAWRRKTLQSDYESNPNTVFSEGRVAEVTLLETGSYEKSQIDGEDTDVKNIPRLPNSAIEVDENKWIVPIDNVKSFMSGDTNPRFGKPLPAEEWRLRAHFIGRQNGEIQYWSLGLKNDAAKNFNVETNRWLHLRALFNEERNAIYGIKNMTLESLTYNDTLDPEDETYVDTSKLNMEDLLSECMAEYVADLLELEDYHESNRETAGYNLVVTDGIVSSMNLTPNEKTGNRVLWVEPIDANYGFDDGDLPDSTPCWIPENVDIDFGIGSDIIVIGRTNQTQRKDEDGNYTDEWNPVSINLFGVMPRIALGTPTVDDSTSSDVDYW